MATRSASKSGSSSRRSSNGGTNRKSSAAPDKSQSGKGQSAALGAVSIVAIGAALAGAVFGLLRLGRGTYTSGQPLAPGSQPEPAGTPADGPRAAAEGTPTAGSAEHVPTDLMGSEHPGFEDRAVDAFRPDPTAPIPEGERDAFRPALAGADAPTLVSGQARELERPGAQPN